MPQPRRREQGKGRKGRFRSIIDVIGILGGLFLIIVLGLGVYADFVWNFRAPDGADRFGDKYFGLASAALSGLAFAGSLYAIYMQRRTLDQTVSDLEESNWEAVYRDLDRAYQDLLALALAKPYLRDETRIPHLEGPQRQEYEVYAYMVWNFVEAIVDRADNSTLGETWQPTVREERRIHLDWLMQSTNRDKFRKHFALAVEYYLLGMREPWKAAASAADKSICASRETASRLEAANQAQQAHEPAA